MAVGRAVDARIRRLCRHWPVALAVLALGEAAFLLTPIHQPVVAYDEGIALYGATRVLHGDLPYRDFWTLYAPSQFYALAGLFRLFGTTVLVARLADTLVRLAITVLVYLFLVRVGPRRAAVLASLVVTLWLAAAGNYGYAMFPALAATLAADLCLLRCVTGGRIRWAALAGLCVGLALTFRHDLGLYTLGAGGGVLTLFSLRLGVTGAGAEPNGARWQAGARLLLPFAGGAALTALPPALYVAAQVPAAAWWHDLVTFPLTTYRDVRARPYPAPAYPLTVLTGGIGGAYLWGLVVSWARMYAPLLVYAAAAFTLVQRRRMVAPPDIAARWWGLLILAGSGAALFAQALSRFDNIHVLPTDVPALMALAVLLTGLGPRPRPRRRPALARGLLPAVTVALLAATYLYWPARTYTTLIRADPPWRCPAGAVRARCVAVPAAQAAVAGYLRAQTRPDERIFIGVTRHDRIFANDVLLYFLAGRASATAYHELHPGVATTHAVQQAIIADLVSQRVQVVVLFAGFANEIEPNGSGVSSGVSDLDDFLGRAYVPVTRVGDYTILARRATPPSPDGDGRTTHAEP